MPEVRDIPPPLPPPHPPVEMPSDTSREESPPEETSSTGVNPLPPVEEPMIDYYA